MSKPKKKHGAKSRKPMESIEEETASLNQDLRYFIDYLPTNSRTAAEILSSGSPKALQKLHFNYDFPTGITGIGAIPTGVIPYPSSNGPFAHMTNQQLYLNKTDFKRNEDMNAGLLNLSNPSENPRVKVVRFNDTSSITKLLFDINRCTSVESMFRPYVGRSEEVKAAELSPRSLVEDKDKIYKLDSEVHFLNSGGRNDVRFVSVTKNNLCLYDLICEYNKNEPRIQLINRRQIPSFYDDPDCTCRCVAIDNSKENRIALGLNSNDIFITNAPDKDLSFTTNHHIRMRQSLDSIVSLAFDKTISGQSYLSCGYERGHESEHFVSLYDINQGKDLISDRCISEKIIGMQFLSTDLSVMLLNCLKSVRFVDIREKTGFSSIMNLNFPLYKIALEPYNNIQFAGVVGNNLNIFDRRYLAKSLYEFEIGPKSYNISHLEFNPNRYANITCCSSSHDILYELDILPTPKYAHHLNSSEPQEAIVTEYVNRFSYDLEQIPTSLITVQNFSWCHQKPNMLITTSCCVPDPELEATDWVQIKLMKIENNNRVVSMTSDNSIIYCDDDSLSQIKFKPQVHQKKQNHSADGTRSQLEEAVHPDSTQEKIELVKRIQQIKTKPTFEMEPEEIDLIFETEKKELELLNEKIDFDHFATLPEATQRKIPFYEAKKQLQPPINRDVQLWFTRSDINQISITRAKLGYGFATIPGSPKALIENSYYAIADKPNETDCLKNCWKMLARIYSSTSTQRLLNRYGTVFPGVRRMSRGLESNAIVREDKITFRNKYYVSERRDEILRLVSWVPLDDYLNLAIKLERLINAPDLRSKTRAASMAMFYLQGNASKSYLEKIETYLETTECTDRYSSTVVTRYKSMVKKMLEVIETNDGIRIKNFEKLLEEIEDPYLNAMLIFLGRRQFVYNYMQRQIMATDTLRLDDRLAIGAIHLDDEGFRHSLNLLTKALEKSYDPLSVLLISGLDDHRYAHMALHSYLKQTNDIQTTALILCAGNCFRRSKIWETYDMRKPVMERILLAIANNALKNTRKYSLQIVCGYMKWLQENNLTLQKSYIMTFLRKKIEFPKSDPKIQAGRTQGLIACNFCGQPILPFIGCDSAADDLLAHLKTFTNTNRKVMSVAQSMQIAEIERRKMLPKTRGCPHCGKPLPRCLICKRACIQQQEPSNMQMKDWFIWCSRCAHGGHLDHLRNWFSVNEVCPAGNCQCACPKIDNDVFSSDMKSNNHNQDLPDDPFLLNGFNVSILSATLDSGPRSRHSSEQDKMRLIKRLCLNQVQSNSSVDPFGREENGGSGFPINMANSLRSICALKSESQQGFIGSDLNSTNDHVSAMSNRSSGYLQVALRNSSLNSDHTFGQLDESRESKKEEVSNEEDHVPEELQPERNTDLDYSEQSWNMLPEVVKKSNAMMRKILSQSVGHHQSHPELSKTPTDDEKDGIRRRLQTSTDSLNSQRRQHVKVVPRKQNKQTSSQRDLNDRPHGTFNEALTTNNWIITNQDRTGRQFATQIRVNIDDPQTAENEPSTSSQTLDNSVRFNQHNILVPVRENPVATALMAGPNFLEQLISVELFKTSVAEERSAREAKEKRIVAQLIKDQIAKEQMRKEARERQKQMRDEANATRSLRNKSTARKDSTYFGADLDFVEMQLISNDSENETEDAKEVDHLCSKLDENILNEEREIERLRAHGFGDLNSLATALRKAEERKRRRMKKNAKKVRIRTTPEIRAATPAINETENSRDGTPVHVHVRHFSGNGRDRKHR